MIVHVLLIVLSIVFFELFVFLRMTDNIEQIVSDSLASMRTLASSRIGDGEKESLARLASARIVKATAGFALKLAAIGVFLYALYRACAYVEPAIKSGIMDRLASPLTIVLLVIVVLLYAWARNSILR